MSFRSTFASAGGFTTQRLDLILKKRKDDSEAKDSDKSRSNSPGERKTASPDAGSVSSPTGGTQESALDRWRRRMSDEGKVSHQKDPATSPTRTPQSSPAYPSSALDDILYGGRDGTGGLTRSNSSVDPIRRKLDFNSNERGWGSSASRGLNDDGGVGSGWRHSSSHMSLPRRRRDKTTPLGGRLRGRQHAVNGGISASSSHLDTSGHKPNSTSNDSAEQLSGGKSSSLRLTPSASERSLTSKRFQQLFSSTDSGDDKDDFPDSLEGSGGEDSDEDEEGGVNVKHGGYNGTKRGAGGGGGLTRSASSASTILRGSGWTPASRLLRDRYDIGGESPATRTGTRSNWAAWRGDIYGAKDEAKGKHTASDDDGNNNNDDDKTRKHSESSGRTDSGKGRNYSVFRNSTKNSNSSSSSTSSEDETNVNLKMNSRPTAGTGRRADDSKSMSVRGVRGDTGVKEQGAGWGSGGKRASSTYHTPATVDTTPSSSSPGKGRPQGGPGLDTESTSINVPPPLHTSLHLASFPGYAGIKRGGGIGGGGRTGHWAGHVPQAARHTQPELFLYKGSANVEEPSPGHLSTDHPSGSKHLEKEGSSQRNNQDTDHSRHRPQGEERSSKSSSQNRHPSKANVHTSEKPDMALQSDGQGSHGDGDKLDDNENEVRSTSSDHDSVFSAEGQGKEGGESCSLQVGSGISSRSIKGEGDANLGVNGEVVNGHYTPADNRHRSAANTTNNLTRGRDGDLQRPAITTTTISSTTSNTTPSTTSSTTQVGGPSVGEVQDHHDSHHVEVKDREDQQTFRGVLIAPTASDHRPPSPGTSTTTTAATRDAALPEQQQAATAADTCHTNQVSAHVQEEVKPSYTDTVVTPGGEGGRVDPPAAEGAGAAAAAAAELARSPRVSFSDDLKVVPPSPSAERKIPRMEAPLSAGGEGVGVKGGGAEGGDMSSTAGGGGQVGAAANRTPVKGILQNGRKEGDIVHRPAPDDSEMRCQEDSGDEKGGATTTSTPTPTSSPSVPSTSSTKPAVGSRRHNSFSTMRDVPHTYKTFMSRPGLHPGDKPRTSSSGSTPTVERRTKALEGSGGGSAQSLYRSPRAAGSSAGTSRTNSLRSSTGQRSSWSSKYRGGEGRPTSNLQDSSIRRSTSNLQDSSTRRSDRDIKPSPALKRQQKLGVGLKGSSDSINSNPAEALTKGHQREAKKTLGTGVGLRGSTDSVNSNYREARTKTHQKETRMSNDTKPMEAHDKVAERERAYNRATKELDNSGFTLSFKGFMEQRKKQGTCVLPRSQDRPADSAKDRGDRREPVQKNDKAEMSSANKDYESAHNSSVTLNSLKQLREKENKDKGRPTDDQGANKGHTEAADHEQLTEQPREGESRTSGSAGEDEDGAFKRKDDSGHRWSFRSKNRRKAQQNEDSSSSSSHSKKDHGVGSVFSNFFKRGKKTKKDSGNDGTSCADAPDGGEGASYTEGDSTPGRRHEESKTGSTGHTDAENDEEVNGSRLEVAEGEGGFSLGPHGHSDNEPDPLSVLFMKSEATDDNDNDQESQQGGLTKRDSLSPHMRSKDHDGGLKPARMERSPVGLLLDMVGSRSDSPALSGISSVDDGTTGGRNRHYEKPDYKHFLDMDSLVASITTGQEQAEAESSSGVSGTGTSESASGMGSLEDLAMALLEAELREEGLLEGEPGLPEPNQDYQDRIQGIKADLQKFSVQVGRALKKHKHGDSTERTPSVSDLSVTSTRSSRSPWLRDPTVDAKPISDPVLRNKLKSARSPGARVSSRDQKILELMMAKREEEKAAEAKRQMARRTWEAQKQQEDAVKSTTEVRRRESLVRQRQKEKDLHKSRRHSESTDSLHSTYSERRDDDDDRRDLEDAHKYKDRQWSSQSQKIAELRSGGRHNGLDPKLTRYRSEGDMRSKVERPWVTTSHSLMLKEKKMAERRLQNLQRKKSQEDRVAMQKREEEEMAKLVLDRQERELRRANSMKEAKEQEQLMQRKLKNYYQKKRHEDRLSDIKRKSREDINSLQSAIEMKQATAQSHLTAVESRRYNELRKSTTDLDTRISRSKENQQRLQEELAAWHEDLHKYSKMMEKRAEEQAKLAVEQKAKRAAEDRRQKERLQKKNFKKLLAQEEEWKADVEASIAMKDAKTRMLQMEKEETVHESRAMAAASQRMREELRSAYSSDTIDQLSRQAQLQAKLGLESNNVNAGLAGSTKNMSTLTLG